jgi:hypothetical protein
MTQLINNIHETREWPHDFIQIVIIVSKKKPKATKYSNHHTVSLTAHTARIGVRILTRRIERKTEDLLGEDQFGFRRGKETRGATGMLRIISGQTLDIDEELCAWFIDWQAAFDHVNWTKLMHIVKGTGIKWHNRRWLSKLYTNQSVKL